MSGPRRSAYGELMGRLYWDKHGVENVNLRIGSSFPEPIDARMLATWLSYADLCRQLAGKVSGNPVTERYQGGGFCAMEYSRKEPSPANPLAD
ncbi:MAG: hypothetical protein MUC89_06480 [Acetobacteraceae bacterium]|nr:hypothetical protein [Acetobacteraceae bacterium]